MKNILLLCIFATMMSCGGSRNLPDAPRKSVQIVQDFTEIKATPSGIEHPTVNGKKISSVVKDELIGATVSLETGGRDLVLTPLADVEYNSIHQDGGIVREGTITGGDPLRVGNQSGWSIIDVIYKNPKYYPTSIIAKVPGGEGADKCIEFRLDSFEKGYYQVLNLENNAPIQDSAGYQYTDACTQEIHYSSLKSAKLDKIFIAERINDDRQEQKTNGAALPGRRY